MPTVFIFTPYILWTVVGFVTHCQQFVNDLEIHVKTNTIFLEVISNMSRGGSLKFDSYQKVYQLDYLFK